MSDVYARDGVNGHSCIRVEAYVEMSDRLDVMRKQIQAALLLHSGRHYCEDGYPRGANLCLWDASNWPCPTGRALGLANASD